MVIFYSYVKLPEGNSVAFQPLPPVCISVPSGRLSEIFPRHFPALVTAKRYKNGSRSDVENTAVLIQLVQFCENSWSQILEFRNFIHGSKAKVLFWSPKHCYKSAKTQTLRIDLAWIFSRMTSWMEPVALSCYVLSQRLGHVLILLIYQYLGRSKKNDHSQTWSSTHFGDASTASHKRTFPSSPSCSCELNSSWMPKNCWLKSPQKRVLQKLKNPNELVGSNVLLVKIGLGRELVYHLSS